MALPALYKQVQASNVQFRHTSLFSSHLLTNLRLNVNLRLMYGQDPRTSKIKVKCYLPQTKASHGLPYSLLAMRRTIEQEVASSTSSNYFAAQGTSLTSRIIVMINCRCRDLFR